MVRSIENTTLYRVFTIVVSLFGLFSVVLSTFHHLGFFYCLFTIVISSFDLCLCCDGPNGTPYISVLNNDNDKLFKSLSNNVAFFGGCLEICY